MKNSNEYKLFGTIGLFKESYIGSGKINLSSIGGVKIPTPVVSDDSGYYNEETGYYSSLIHNFTTPAYTNQYIAITILPNVANTDSTKKAVVTVGGSQGYM